MIAVKKAIRARAIGDATLTTLVGGNHIYQRSPEVRIDDFDKVVTFWCVTETVDRETGLLSQMYQFDIWARKADDGDAIAERISELFGWNPATSAGGILPALVGRRLAEPMTAEPVPPDQVEQLETGTLHHKVRQFRVATYPA